MAKITIFFQDLNDDVQEEIIYQLTAELKEEIKEAAERLGVEEEDVAIEVVSDWINTHNFGVHYEI